MIKDNSEKLDYKDMKLLDYFAGQVINGMCACGDYYDIKDWPKISYDTAKKCL